MRIVLVAAVLMVVGFAGCIGDDASVDAGSQIIDAQAPYRNAQVSTEMPSRQFEPKLVLETEFLELEQGEVLELSFNITDLHDYEFPLSFIDWNITYNREPNPVAIGEAPDLPGTWSRTLFAEDYHVFKFSARDGQGFEANKALVIKVGDPPPLEGPIEEAPAAGGDGNAVFEPMTIDVSVATEGTCSAVCTVAGTFGDRSLAASACPGMKTGTNGVGCAWVEIPPSAVGASFTISDTAGNDPDARALDACKPNAFQIASYGAIGPESGEILPGTGCLMAWFFEDVAGDIVFHVDEFQNAVSGHIPFDTEPLLSYSSQPVTGCAEDVVSITIWLAGGPGTRCLGLSAGPYSGINDGVWFPLDARYEGAAVKGEISVAELQGVGPEGGLDTDCLFLDHMLNIVGSAHGDLGPCNGVVPADAHWMYVYPYGNGQTYPGIQIDFTLDSAIASAAEEQGRPVGETLMEDYEDLGSVWKHKETNICYVKESSFTAAVPGVHYVAFGTWFFQESNGIPGLQVSQDDLAASTYAGSPAPDGCTGGDLTAV